MKNIVIRDSAGIVYDDTDQLLHVSLVQRAIDKLDEALSTLENKVNIGGGNSFSIHNPLFIGSVL